MPATCPAARETPYGGSAKDLAAAARLDGRRIGTEQNSKASLQFTLGSFLRRPPARSPAPGPRPDWMAHAADARSRCVVAVLFAVAVFLACLPPAATASSSSRSGASSRPPCVRCSLQPPPQGHLLGPRADRKSPPLFDAFVGFPRSGGGIATSRDGGRVHPAGPAGEAGCDQGTYATTNGARAAMPRLRD